MALPLLILPVTVGLRAGLIGSIRVGQVLSRGAASVAGRLLGVVRTNAPRAIRLGRKGAGAAGRLAGRAGAWGGHKALAPAASLADHLGRRNTVDDLFHDSDFVSDAARAANRLRFDESIESAMDQLDGVMREREMMDSIGDSVRENLPIIREELRAALMRLAPQIRAQQPDPFTPPNVGAINQLIEQEFRQAGRRAAARAA